MTHRATPFLLAALLAPPLVAQDQDFFGAGVAFAGDELLVVKRAPARGPAAVYVFARNGEAWQKRGELRADGAVDRGWALSPQVVVIDGHLVAGAGDPDNRIGAHVWTRRNGSWLPGTDVRLAPADTGVPVVTLAMVMRVLQPVPRGLAASGDLVLVGVANRAHLFRRQGNDWQRVPIETPAAPGTASAVALGTDVALIGAPLGRGGVGEVAVATPGPDGTWRTSTTLAPDSLPRAAAFGIAIALDGNTLAVGAPGASMVIIYERQGSAWSERQRLTAEGVGGLGAAVALRGDELLVGAPRGRAAVRYRRTDGGWTEAARLAAPTGADGTSFGAAVALGAEAIAVGAPNAAGGRGRVWLFPRRGEGLGAAVELQPAPSPRSVSGAERRCEGGGVEGFQCDNVDLQSFLSIESLGGAAGERVTDVWGWTDPVTRREYALVGRTGGLVFVDITDPARPAVLGHLPANPSGARSVKTHANHAYVAGDGAGEHGLLVFDLTRLREASAAPRVFTPDTVYRGIASAHNLAVDTLAGLIIATAANSGGTTCGGGLHLIDVRQPRAPRFAGCFTDTEGLIAPGRTHDVQCTRYHGPDSRFTGRTICFASNETALRIVDVTDPAAPVALGRASHPGTGYIHQGWLTEDQRHFFLNDELDELAGTTDRTRTMIWDVRDLEDPVLVGTHLGPDNATDHNLFIRGNRMYLANYQAGFRVVDVSDPLAPREVGYFDTTPYEGNASGFYGAWGSYPFFASGNVIVTSMQEGLFVLKPRPPVVP